MIKKTTTFFLRLIFILGLFLGISVGLVLFNPAWVSTIATQALSKYGVKTDIHRVDSHFLGTTYQLDGTFSVADNGYGIQVNQAKFQADFDWLAPFSGKSFIKKLAVNQSTISVDSQKLRQQITAKKRVLKSNHWRLPRQWQIKNTVLFIDKQKRHISALGQADAYASIIVKGDNSSPFIASYDKKRQTIKLNGQKLDLKPLTGKPLTLHQINATLNTHNWLASRARAVLAYGDQTVQLRVTGNNEQLSLVAKTDQKTVTLTAQPLTKDNNVVKFYLNDLDLSALQAIRPLIPQTTAWLGFNGTVSGTLTTDWHKGLQSAQLALKDVRIKHAMGGINHLFGAVSYAKNTWHLTTQLQNSTLDWPSQFPNGIQPLSGKANLRYHPKTHLLTLDNINLKNADIQFLTAKGYIDLLKQKIDLNATAKNVNLSKRHRLIPAITPPKTKQWLNAALISGKENHTTLIMRGFLTDFFERSGNIFDLTTRIRDSVLHYEDNNPDIHIKTATLKIKNRQLAVVIDKANIQGIPITGKAHIADLENALLVIHAGFKQQALKKVWPIAEKSVARQSLLEVQKKLGLTGKISMQLVLKLAIDDAQLADRFRIQLTGQNLAIALKSYRHFLINSAKIAVVIDEKGLQKASVHGRYNKKPITTTISRNHAHHYQVISELTTNAVALLYKLKIIDPKAYQTLQRQKLIVGQSRYRFEKIMDKNGNLTQLKATSQLSGTTLNLFDLVSKPSASQLPLSIRFNQKNHRLSINLKKRFMLETAFDKKGHIAGFLLDNRRQAKPYQTGRFGIYWTGKKLDMKKLYQFGKIFMHPQKTPLPAKHNYQFNIAIDALKLNKNTDVPIKINGTLQHLTVNSPLIAGDIYYRPNHLRADLSHLAIDPLFTFFATPEVTPEGRATLRLNFAQSLPKIQLTIDQLIYKKSPIGKATVKTSIQKGRYSIDEIFVHGKNYFFEASGYEAQEPQGITTHLQTQFKGEDIRKIVTLLKMPPTLDGKFIDISANLSWPGKAHQLNLRHAYGTVKLDAQNVKLINVDAGLGSVVGLMDFAGILKRISLDFQNLTSSKISFDTVKGNWNIGGGRAMTRNAYAEGSVIDLNILGGLDLYHRTFDHMRVNVIPKASNIIPIIGAATAGPIGAFVGLVVEKITGSLINNVVKIPYVVSGHWNDPKILPANQKQKKKPTRLVLKKVKQ